MTDQYNWHTLPERQERSMGKMKLKLPMQQKVMTEDYEVWRYEFTNDGILWHYCYSTFPVN